VRGWIGAQLSLGAIIHDVSQRPQRSTLALGAGPTSGLTAMFGPHVGFWSELSVVAMGYRRDNDNVVALVPAAWLGALVEL
jgi:hypothetical protein